MRTAVITTGGLGTRLLTSTKGNPKTMLPLFDKSPDRNADPSLRPLLETIFENLYDFGFRRFCFIVGSKTKNSILNHMTPDPSFIQLLKKRNSTYDTRFIRMLTRLYKKINNSKISWIQQPTPMGFGHALLSAKKFVKNDTFLLHAGDAYFPNYEFISDFTNLHKTSKNVSGTLLIQKKKTLQGYGIAQLNKKNNLHLIFDVEEKPKNPKSNWVILPIYVFEPTIFKALEKTERGYNNELQVTDAIKTLLNWNKKIMGYNFGKKQWFDIGNPRNYFKALNYSYSKSLIT